MGQLLVHSGHIRLSYPGEFQLCEFNVLISAIESFMEKVWSLLNAKTDKLACRVVTLCRVVAL